MATNRRFPPPFSSLSPEEHDLSLFVSCSNLDQDLCENRNCDMNGLGLQNQQLKLAVLCIPVSRECDEEGGKH